MLEAEPPAQMRAGLEAFRTERTAVLLAFWVPGETSSTVIG
ncbi:MAG: hypothetical protein P8J87_05125 [Verrucomicrobiales bacterium]|nr:hypothetical protein [Verrucomicrobiales bacterium]